MSLGLASPIRRQLLELRLIATCQRPDKDPQKDPLTSPLERLELLLDRQLGLVDRLEMIRPFAVPPWWQPPQVQINDSRESALAAHAEIQQAQTTGGTVTP